MSTNVQVRGTTYSIPTPGDSDFGQKLTVWMQAVSASPSSAVNVQDPLYGAIGNNVADDAAAIQAALTAAGNQGGGDVLLPPPSVKYKVGSPLTVPANVTLVGTYGSSVINFSSIISGQDAITLTGNGSRMRGVSLTGAFGRGIVLSGTLGQVQSMKVQDCEVTGATQVPVASDYTAGIATASVDGVEISGCYLHGNGHDYGDGTGYGFDITTVSSNVGPNRHINITRNYCSSTKVMGNINAYASSAVNIEGNFCTGALVQHGSSAQNGGYGIELYHSAGAVETGKSTVTANRVIGTQGTGIYLQGQPGTACVGNYVENTCQTESDFSLLVAGIACNAGPSSIVGNTIVTSGKDGISIEGYGHVVTGNNITGCTNNGIKIVVADHLTVIGNTCSGCNRGIVTFDFPAGSDVNAVTDITIVGNHCFGNTNEGIGLRNISNSVMSANQCSENGGSGLYLFSARDCVLSDNMAHDNVTNGIALVQTTHSKISDNLCVGTTAGGAWANSHAYATSGVIVSNSGGLYFLVLPGTSASSGGPTGTGTGIVDGTCVWNYYGATQNTGILEDSSGTGSDYNRFEGNKAHGNSNTDFAGVTGAHSTASGNWLGVNTQVNLSAHQIKVGDDLANQMLLQGDISSNAVHITAQGAGAHIPVSLEPKSDGVQINSLAKIYSNTGAPTGTTAPNATQGSIYLRTDGVSGSILYGFNGTTWIAATTP